MAVPILSRRRKWRPFSRPLGRFGRFCVGVSLVAAAYIAWIIATSFMAYTDDAYVRSDLVAVAPQVTGHIIAVLIADNQEVHRGDILVKIDPEPFQIAFDAAQASLRQAQATAQADADQITGVSAEVNAATAALGEVEDAQRRTVVLSHEGFASAQSFDASQAALNTAKANLAASRAAFERAQALLAAQQAAVAAAQANLDGTQWALQHTVIRAPADGTVNNLDLHVGDTAQANTPLIGIISATAWRVIANYKQSYLRDLHPGGTAWVWLDADPWHFHKARIRGIGRGIARQEGGTGLLPYVAPTTDWIRLQHRFPVTIVLVDPPANLTLYMGEDASCVVFP